MADWTALAGASGLAAALEEIQNRRAREGELQRRLTEGQGEWSPAPGGMGGALGFFDALFGYNRPNEIGIGSQRYAFKPYDPVTPEQAKAWGMTVPESTTTPEYLKELPTGVQGPPELVPAQETTRDIPMPGIVGMRLGPKEKMALFQEQLKERRELAKLEREQALFRDMNLGGLGVGSSLPGGTPLPPDTPAGQVPVPTQTPVTGAVTPTGGAAPGPVPGVENLSPQFRGKAQLMANRLGVNLDDFYRVMAFETGGEFSPATKNRAGSGATGLIQFTKETAKRLGTTTEALAQMTPEQQLDYVEKYLAPFRGKMGNLKDLYMAVLYPAAVGKSDDTVLFTPDKNPLEYRQNAGLDTARKGYVTVGDAVAAVQRSTGTLPATSVQAAPAEPQERMPAPGTPAAPADALTNRYITQFRQGSEQDALKVVVAAEDSGDQTKALAAKRALEQVFPRGPAQEQAAARPDTSMMVAGPSAPAPPEQPTAGQPQTAPLDPRPGQAETPLPFQLSPEGRRQIVANNATIARNELEIRDLDMKQRQANYLGATRKNPQLGAIATQLGQRIADLSRQNQSLRDMSEKTLQDEAREWRARGDVLAREGRARQEKLEERQRRPGELAAEKTAERTAEEAYYDTRPVGEHPKIKSEEYFVRASGDPIDDAMLTREMRARNKAGQLTRLADTESRKQLTTLKMLEPLLKQYTDLVQYAYGTREDGTPGPLAQFSRSPYATTRGIISQVAQSDPTLQAKRRALEGQLQTVVRALGARGDLNQQELEAAKGLIANMDASVGLGLSLGPMYGTGGLGVGGTVKPSISIPDTPAVGVKLANELVDLVNSRIGSLLRNKDYQGTPQVTLPTAPAVLPPPPTPVAARLRDMTPAQILATPASALPEVRNTQDLEGQGFSKAQANAIRTRVSGRVEATLGPAMGQTTPLNPQWSRSRIPQMTPEAIRNAPPEVITDVNRVSDIAGLTTEQRKALAARLRQRNEEAVKRRRAS